MNNDKKPAGIIDHGLAGIGDISISDQKRYQLPLLLRLARQVTILSPECEICRNLQLQITQLGTDLTHQSPTVHQSLEDYLSVMKSITMHLKRSHGLVEKRYYVKRYVLISFTFGIMLVLLGLILLSFGITLLTLNITLIALVTRVGFSYTIGYFLDRKARKRGRVI